MTIPGITPPAGEEEEVRTEGPGARLRRCREAKQLDVATVATMLHLSEAKLSALESERFDQLPGPVYIQGYLRNYARLLGEPVEEILEAYHAWDPSAEKVPKLEGKHRSMDKSGHRNAARAVTWLIGLGLVFLVVLWLQGNLKGIEKHLAGGLEDVRTAVTPTTQEQAPAPSNGGTMRAPLPPLPAASVETQTESNAATPADVPAVAAPPETVNEPQPLIPAADAVVMELQEASWVEVRDATGKLRINDLLSAGSRKVLEGAPPYQILLGNAAGVRITIGGKPFDLQSRTHANVARFTLDPETTDTP
jgi:cytoskeleton protein RodZ